MKRSILVVFILVLILSVSPGVFASLMDFSVVWRVENQEQSLVDILNYETPTPWSSFDPLDPSVKIKQLDVVNDTYLAEVCRIRFTSNKGGMHIVRIGSTPLTDNVNSYGYNLSLSCDGNVEFLEIPDDASSSVPVSFYLPYSAGFTYKDIFMDAILSELDSMTPGTFKATVTIEVESNA